MMVEPNSEQRIPHSTVDRMGDYFLLFYFYFTALGRFFLLLHFKIRSIVQFVCYIQYKPIVDIAFWSLPHGERGLK